jgi:hypothetical protein
MAPSAKPAGKAKDAAKPARAIEKAAVLASPPAKKAPKSSKSAAKAAAAGAVSAEPPREMALDAKTTAALTERLKRRPAPKVLPSKDIEKTTGVIYVGHVPHGFFEEQMRPFFEQVRAPNGARRVASRRRPRAHAASMGSARLGAVARGDASVGFPCARTPRSVRVLVAQDRGAKGPGVRRSRAEPICGCDGARSRSRSR